MRFTLKMCGKGEQKMNELRERMRVVGDRYDHLRKLLDKKYDEYWEYALTPEEALRLNAWHNKLADYLRDRMIKELLRCEYLEGEDKWEED